MRLLSRIKEKIRDVLQEGEASRGTFTPQGKPLEIYLWWRQNTSRKNTKVGLCGYFWIVVLWAPLLFVRKLLGKLFSDRQFWRRVSLAVLTILVGLGVGYPSSWGAALLSITAFCAGCAGVVIGYALTDYIKDKTIINDIPKWVRVLALALILPALPAVIFGIMIGAIGTLLTSRTMKRFYRWMGSARLVKGRVSPLRLLMLTLAVGFVVWSVVGGWWIVPLVIATAIAVVLVAKRLLEIMGFYVAKRRDERRMQTEAVTRQRSLAALQPVLRIIFAHFHPGNQNEEDYWMWYREYVARTEERAGKLVWSNIYHRKGIEYFPLWWDWGVKLYKAVNKELQDMREQELLAKQQTEQQRQQLMQKITTPASVVGDFIILIAQRIRVSKWKICPAVELPEDT